MDDVIENAPAPEQPIQKQPRKPRVKKSVNAGQVPLHLPKPTLANGSANATLGGTVEKKFSRIALVDPKTKKVIVIHSTKKDEKVLSPGSATVNFVYALVDGALAGQGAGPDGSALYCVEQYSNLVKYWGAHIKSYLLVCEPAGRAGAQGYAGTLDEFMGIVGAKAKLITASLKKYGVAKAAQRTRKDKDEVIEVRL